MPDEIKPSVAEEKQDVVKTEVPEPVPPRCASAWPAVAQAAL